MLESMGDEPRFQSPKLIVHRPEPVNDAKPPKLTADEVQALLAVDHANRPNGGRTLWRRGRIAILPTALLQLAAHVFFGSAGIWIGFGVVVVAIVWCARPLFKRDEWS